LKHTLVMLAEILDTAEESKSLEHVVAVAHQCFKVTEDTIHHPQHSWNWSWPLLGIPSPVKREEASWTSTEKSAIAAFHRDKFVLENAQKKYGEEDSTPAKKGDPKEGGRGKGKEKEAEGGK
jgi:hypothetical protein